MSSLTRKRYATVRESFDARHVKGKSWPDYSDPLVRVTLADGPCWDWTGATANGYARIRFEGKSEQAHRVGWLLAGRSIPPGAQVDHLCRRPICVNPDHMEPVTQAENILRGDGPSAHHARKTACPLGKPFDGESDGSRTCSSCDKVTNRKAQAKRHGHFVGSIPASTVQAIREGIAAGIAERRLAASLLIGRSVVRTVRQGKPLRMRFPASDYTEELHQALLQEAHYGEATCPARGGHRG